MKVSLTFDTDWAHPIVMDYVLELLDNYNQKATIFATNKYDALFEKHEHEIGVHPNFNDLLIGEEKDFRRVIDELINIYPSATGFRSHSLTNSTHIINYFKSNGYVYDSNIFFPQKGSFFKDNFGFFRFMHNITDYQHIQSNKQFHVKELNLEASDSHILLLHPIHIYLNTPTIEFYDSIKHLTNNPEISNCRNVVIPGYGDLFIDFLNHLKQRNIKTETLKSKLIGL